MPGAPHARRRGHVQRADRAGHARGLTSAADPIARLAASLGDLADAVPPQDGPVPAAVLVALLVPMATATLDDARVVLTRRRADLHRHAGEISFPGGRVDPADRDLRATALREAEEEIGLTAAAVRVLGALDPVSTFVTNYLIAPFVGVVGAAQSWRVSPLEVDGVLEPTLGELRGARSKVTLQRRGFEFETDAFVLGDDVVWGATWRILDDLLARATFDA